MATQPKPTAQPCNRFNSNLTPCGNKTTSPDGWCHQCAGLTSGQVSEADTTVADAVAADDAVVDLRDQAEASTQTGSGPEPTATLLSQLAQQVSQLAEAGDLDAAEPLINGVASTEDAVLDRHPDPLGAAVIEGVWGAPEVPQSRQQVTRWLADNIDDGDPKWINEGLRSINPGAETACDLAVARLEYLRAPHDSAARERFTSLLSQHPQARPGAKDPATARP